MKGQVAEVILTIGILVAGGITILQLRGVFVAQQQISKEEVVTSFAKDLASVVDKAVATTGDAAFVYYPSIKQYRIEVKNNIVLISDKVSGRNSSFSRLEPEIVSNQFEDCDKIFVVKQKGKIVLMCKCLDLGNVCTDSLLCCSGYCNAGTGKCEESPVCPADRICTGAPESSKDSLGKDCCPSDKPVCTSGHCCPSDKPKWCESPVNGNPRCMSEQDYNDDTKCKEEICPSTISQCYNQWHWNNYDGTFNMNVFGYVCDYYEVCHPNIVPIIKEIIDCCNNKCAGSCHTMCSNAVSDSGLSSSDTPETRKKCYGLYAIYGLDGAAKWMKGYQIRIEQPASVMLTQGTWMCTGYSIALTTLLRSVGYSKDEAYSVAMNDGPGCGHAFNLVKFPGETNYRFVDTVGNSLYISGISSSDPYRQQCGACRTESLNQGNGCQNDEGVFSCPSNVYLGVSC